MRGLKGFTLSELMVALAVIGVLVAVVTPAIMKTRPNKNKMMVKKTFYATEQIVSTLINDEQLYPDMREVCEGSGDSSLTCAWGFDYVDAVKYEGVEYEGDYKFAALFKDRLNISKNASSPVASSAGADGSDFYPVFYTTDGVKWDLTGTEAAWTSGQNKVGTFEEQTDAAGIGAVLIDVNGDDAPNCRESDENCSGEDFDQYQVEILANGKLRIHPDDTKAVEYATINTSIRDAL